MSDQSWSHHDAGEWKIRTRPSRSGAAVLDGHAWYGEAKRKADGEWAEHALKEPVDCDIYFNFGATESDVVAKLRREVCH